MTERAVVVTGVGAHVDPWHGLDATSAAAGALLAARFDVAHTTTDELARLDGAALVVVNAAGDLERPTVDSRPIVDALLAAHRAGVPILALHASALAFRDDPRWAELIGGRWVPGVTFHPQIGTALVQQEHGASTLYDERYTALERHDGTHLLAFHTEDGMTHPLVWWRAPADGGTVGYDALGHGVESYLTGHAAVLQPLLDALVGSGRAPVAPVETTERWQGAAVAALGYELIALASDAAALGAAPDADVAATSAPHPRLAAGYLALESYGRPDAARIISHGRPVGEVRFSAEALVVDVAGAVLDGAVLRAPVGVAVVAELGDWSRTPDGHHELRGTPWRAVVVHGPASAKVENRIRLLDDLRGLAGAGEGGHG